MRIEDSLGHLLNQIEYHPLRLAFCCVAFIAGVILLSAYFEASAFNRLTGQNATLWDALFTELRVQGIPR